MNLISSFLAALFITIVKFILRPNWSFDSWSQLTLTCTRTAFLELKSKNPCESIQELSFKFTWTRVRDIVASPHQTVIGRLILAVSKLPPVPLPSFEVTSKFIVHTVLNGIPVVVASVVVTDVVRFSGCIQACRVICRWWWLPVWPQAADGGKARRTNGMPLQRGQTVAAGKTDGRERKHF